MLISASDSELENLEVFGVVLSKGLTILGLVEATNGIAPSGPPELGLEAAEENGVEPSRSASTCLLSISY